MSVMLTITNPLTDESSMIDLSVGEGINMNFRFSEIATLAVTGSFTREFRVPLTPDNIDFFGPLFNVNFAGEFSFHKKAPAIIAVDTIPVSQGHVQIRKCYIRADMLADLEIVFYAETPDLVKELGNKKLSDLDYTDIDHEITHENISDGGVDWKYALTDRGQKWSQLFEAGTREVLNDDSPILLNELTLIIRHKWIFLKIMQEAGFQFIGATVETELDAMWMAFINAKQNSTGIPASSFFFKAELASDSGTISSATNDTIASLTEIYDNNNNFTSNKWTAPHDGYFTFNLWATFDPATGGQILTKLKVRRVGDGTILYTSQQVNGVISQNTHIAATTTEIFAQAGDELELIHTTLVPGGANFVIKADADPSFGTGWAMVGASEPTAGATISAAANAPDMLQVDYVKSIAGIFNMAIIPDRNIPNVIYGEPLVEYLASGVERDWTAKIDMSEKNDVTISPTTDEQKKTLSFKYKEGTDILSKQYTNVGRIYGEYIVDGYTPADTIPSNDFAQGELSIQLGFQSCPANAINGTNILIQKFVTESGDFTKPLPTILYAPTTTVVSVYNELSNTGEATNIWLLSHYSDIYPEIVDFDLNFAPENPLYPIETNPYNNLFNRWYRNYLNEIYSPEARILTAMFALDIPDIIQFKFNDRIWIRDAWWRILEISDYAMNSPNLTKVTLIKILSIIPDCTLHPVNQDAQGYIEFEDELGDPQDPSQSCCERYGYTWVPGESKCRANIIVSEFAPPDNGFGGSGNAHSYFLSTRSSISPDNIYSYFAGTKLSAGQGNPMMIMVGDTLKMLGEHRGAALFGKNVLAAYPGFHVGGGWFEDEGTVEGRAQFGDIALMTEGSFDDADTPLVLTIEGITGKHLEIEDSTSWTCTMHVSVMKYDAGLITENGHGIFTFNISKSNRISASSTIYTVDRLGFTGLSLGIDTATDDAQHRFLIADIGNPSTKTNIKISARLSYSQVHQ